MHVATETVLLTHVNSHKNIAVIMNIQFPALLITASQNFI